MRNDRQAKTRRRTVAAKNLKAQLAQWEKAKSPDEIMALMSDKWKNQIATDETIDFDGIRNRKILEAKAQLKKLAEAGAQ